VRVRRASPDSRLVVLTIFDNLRYVQALSRLGIDAYIHKSSSEEELVATVEALAREPQGGDTVVSVPRGSLERMGEGPWGSSPRGRRRCWCMRPAASPTTR
jgi:DNA-binding NarL/FixJ family response regulator